MKTEDFFTIHRGWNNKLLVWFGLEMAELKCKDFVALPVGQIFTYNGRRYEISEDGRVI